MKNPPQPAVQGCRGDRGVSLTGTTMVTNPLRAMTKILYNHDLLEINRVWLLFPTIWRRRASAKIRFT